jgi:hypothetical protein
MPLHEVGYRAWRGRLLGPLAVVVVIATTGIALAWTSRWLRRAVLFAWSPALVFGASFFAFEQAVEEGRFAAIEEGVRNGRNLDGVGLPGTVLADALGGSALDPSGLPRDLDSTRHLVWSRLLLAFMRAPQAVLLAVVVGLVAPTLVSRDLRAKAWLVYFTRPVGRTEYVLGKCLILVVLIGGITLLPGLALWGVGVLVSPSVRVALATCDLPLKVLASSLAVAVPTVLVALAYSSLTSESRIASFAWFATWAACWIAHGALTTADAVAATRTTAGSGRLSDGGADPDDPLGQLERELDRVAPRPGVSGGERPTLAAGLPPGVGRQFRWLAAAAGVDPRLDRWAWMSPYHALGVVQASIFGIERRPAAVVPSLAMLVMAACAAAGILAWRVDAPARV